MVEAVLDIPHVHAAGLIDLVYFYLHAGERIVTRGCMLEKWTDGDQNIEIIRRGVLVFSLFQLVQQQSEVLPFRRVMRKIYQQTVGGDVQVAGRFTIGYLVQVSQKIGRAEKAYGQHPVMEYHPQHAQNEKIDDH